MSNWSFAARLRLVMLVALAAAALVPAANASAATCTATDTSSFASCVQTANSTTGANTINVSGGTYNPSATTTFTNTTGTLTIQGPTPSVSSNQTPAKFTGGALQPTGYSAFVINSGVNVQFHNVELTVAGGQQPAIDDLGTVTLDRVTLASDQTAGLQVETGATATLTNSTISDLTGGTGIIDQGTTTLLNSTVTRAPGGGIDNSSGALTLKNSIVAQNSVHDCFAAATVSDHSLDGDSSCGVGTLSGKTAGLGSLRANGGSTPTDLPASTSPALAAGNSTSCLTVDQRGAARPSACDLGAAQTFYSGPAPVLTNQDMNVTTTSSSGTTVNYTPTWNANSPVSNVTCAPASGTNFPVGTTAVHCSGTDSFNQTGNGQFNVVVTQQTYPPPTITTPSNITTPATSNSGAVVNYTVTAVAHDGGTDHSVTPTCTPASGSTFAVTTTTVNCSATDGLSQTSSKSFTVTVYYASPSFTAPSDISTSATSPSGATVNYQTPTATDPIDGTIPVTCAPASGATYPIGQTTVSCSATDSGSRKTTHTFNVTVADNTPPTITVPADISTPATSAQGAQVAYSASATDPVDGTVPVVCQPTSGSLFGIGQTTVTCTATDAAHNQATKTFLVTVTNSTPATISVAADTAVPATPGNAPPPKPGAVLSSVQANAKGQTIVLMINTTGPGSLSGTGTFKQKVHGKMKNIPFASNVTTAQLGSSTLTLRPGKAAKSALSKLSKRKRLPVAITVTFTPISGAPTVEHLTVSLKGLH